jgi:dienelactone hydrolase
MGPIMHNGYEPEAAADARARILAFFSRHLQDPPAA